MKIFMVKYHRIYKTIRLISQNTDKLNMCTLNNREHHEDLNNLTANY